MKTYIITKETNFIRIFRLPLQYPAGFCFQGGYPVEIQLVDWFNPFLQSDFWDGKVKKLTQEEMESHRDILRAFIMEKQYVKQLPLYSFLGIATYGDAFII